MLPGKSSNGGEANVQNILVVNKLMNQKPLLPLRSGVELLPRRQKMFTDESWMRK